MRIPEPFFPVLNRVMRLLLNSPLHGLMSGSVMVVYFTGRKTGRQRSTPVRYLHEGDTRVVCLTGRETGWWPNFLEPRDVELQLAGQRVAARAPRPTRRHREQVLGTPGNARAVPGRCAVPRNRGQAGTGDYACAVRAGGGPGTWWYRSTC